MSTVQTLAQRTYTTASRVSAFFALSIALFLFGCGSGTVNSGNPPTPTPTPTPSTANEWTWMSGSSTVGANGGQSGVYGTLGVSSSSNVPGGRAGAISWTDEGGNLWLFGGNGYDSAGTLGLLNDLWKFSPTAKTWTWVSGSNTGTSPSHLHGPAGMYGTLGIPSATSVPGERAGAVSWIDASGDLWLFGGAGYDSVGALGNLNDLWKFNPADMEWTWMGGSGVQGASDVYGTEGVPATTNVPGARELAISWTDSSGNFWLFGGYGNDLWEFRPTTKEWTWMGGSDTDHANGIYGAQGVAAASNTPGGRQEAVSWTDKSGNLWLFGDAGYDSTGAYSTLNDLWEFRPTTKEWAWISGADTGGAIGVYGTQGASATSNVPGARISAVSWIDSDGNLWLSSGLGLDSTGGNGWLNDLWEFNPTTKGWVWISGSDTTYANSAQYQPDRGQSGVYGTEGEPAATNVPGGRYSAVSWTDSSGNFWLFGGAGHDSTAAQIGDLNDLWRYQP